MFSYCIFTATCMGLLLENIKSDQSVINFSLIRMNAKYFTYLDTKYKPELHKVEVSNFFIFGSVGSIILIELAILYYYKYLFNYNKINFKN